MPLDCLGIIKCIREGEGKTPQCWRHADLLWEMHQRIAALGLQYSFTHVQAHQDNIWDWEQLSWSAQLNCKCDAMAKSYLKWVVAIGGGVEVHWQPNTAWGSHIRGHAITSNVGPKVWDAIY